MGYTGKGIVITILDDGLEKDHPDLQANYVSILAISGLKGIRWPMPDAGCRIADAMQCNEMKYNTWIRNEIG